MTEFGPEDHPNGNRDDKDPKEQTGSNSVEEFAAQARFRTDTWVTILEELAHMLVAEIKEGNNDIDPIQAGNLITKYITTIVRLTEQRQQFTTEQVDQAEKLRQLFISEKILIPNAPHPGKSHLLGPPRRKDSKAIELDKNSDDLLRKND